MGHDRPPGERGASLGASGYRKARRAMSLADELGLPLVTVIGIVDVIVAEGAGEAPSDVEGTLAEGVAATVGRELRTLLSEEPGARLRARQERWRLPSP